MHVGGGGTCTYGRRSKGGGGTCMRAKVEHACGRRWKMHAGGGGTCMRAIDMRRRRAGGDDGGKSGGLGGLGQ